MTARNDIGDFDGAVRTALDDVARATTEAPALADRLIANARADGASADVRTRRAARWTMPLLAAAAVVVLAVGGVVTAHLASEHDRKPDRVGTHVPSPAPTHATSTAHPSTSRSVSKKTGPTRTKKAVRRPALTAAQVENATIDIPSWSAAGGDAADQCKAVPISFHDGRADMPGDGSKGRDGYQFLGSPAVGDVDGDGVDDAVVVLFCAPYQPVAYRVLALRGARGGGVDVIGDVVVPLPFAPGSGRLGYPRKALGISGGAVNVQWGDDNALSGNGGTTQVRSYRDQGGTFAQSAGPTQFADSSADLSVTAPDATLTPGSDGAVGTLRVTVHNAGPKKSGPDVTVIVDARGLSLLGVTHTDGSHVTSDVFAPHQFRVFMSNLAPGTSRTLLFRFSYRGPGTPKPATIDLSGSADDYAPANNDTKASFTIV